MRLEQLEYLVEVARTGSINQASEQLHTTQQNVSRALKQLEKDLDAALLVRTYRGVELTEAGRKTLALAQEILPKIYKLKEDCTTKPNENELSGEIRLLCVPASILALLSDLIKKFSGIYPNIRLSVEEMEAGALYEALAADREAVGIASMFLNHKLPPKAEKYIKDIHQEILYVDRLAAFVSKYSPWAKQKSISLSSLIKYPLGMYICGDPEDNHICNVLREYGEYNIAFISQNLTVYMQTMAQGQYIGFTSNQVFKRHRFYDKSSMMLLPVRDNAEFSNSISVNQDFIMTPAAERLIEFIKAEFKASKIGI